MGTSVLILLDGEYFFRFWTNFEAWLSMQACCAEGLSPDRVEPLRYTIVVLESAAEIFREKLVTKWTVDADWEGGGDGSTHKNVIVDQLEARDIYVTNKSDKSQQLVKAAALVRTVKHAKQKELELEGASKEAYDALVLELKAELDPTEAKVADDLALEDADEGEAVAAAEKEHHEKWFRDLPPGTIQVAGGKTTHHRFLMCKGVEWGFQYHNFYGDWEISEVEPLCNNRPHYVHNTMYGGYAHLFHCVDPHYNVPRWVIGPAPGNENGWAFCESDAPTPWEVTATWISWDGYEWHTCKNFRYVTKEHELDGLSDLDEEEEEAEAAEAAEAKQDDDEAESTGEDGKKK